MIKMRYIVDDVDKAVEFYTTHLDFRLEQQFGPAWTPTLTASRRS